MRLLCVPNEWPLPANTGGRIDVWRRMRYLHQAGVQLGLLTWYDPPRNGSPSPEQVAEAHQLCDSLHLAAIDRSPTELLRRLSLTGRLPSHAASRWVSLKQAEVLNWAREFKPDVLLLDGLYGVAVVRWLSTKLRVPWIYRSHNIEHLYMQRQSAEATSWRRKLGINANRLGLKALETRTLHAARDVFDISRDDQQFWLKQGVRNIQWLPPAVDDEFAQTIARHERQSPLWDVLYFGNLNTPNNVAAVRWLAREVLPNVDLPQMTVAISGSRPSSEVRKLAESDSRITLLPDPPDMAAVISSAKVIVNPVQSGSGVNLKSVEMLFTRARLVSTSIGVQGIGAEAAACFSIADSPAAFSSLIKQALMLSTLSASNILKRKELHQLFNPKSCAMQLLERSEEILSRSAQTPK